MNKKLIIPIFILLIVVGILAGMKIQTAISDDKIDDQVRKFRGSRTKPYFLCFFSSTSRCRALSWSLADEKSRKH